MLLKTQKTSQDNFKEIFPTKMKQIDSELPKSSQIPRTALFFVLHHQEFTDKSFYFNSFGKKIALLFT